VNWNAPPPQEIREPYSRASQDALFDVLSRLAHDVPLLALDRVGLLESEAQRDRILQLGFSSALIRQRDVATFYLPAVMGRPWMADASFPNACELAKLLEPETAEKLLWTIARKNPDVALRQTEGFLDLPFGAHFFDRVVRAAPDEAVGIASGASRSAGKFRDALRASQDSGIKLLADLSQDRSIDAPRLRRVALLHERMAHGELSMRSAAQIAGSLPRYFAALADMRLAAARGETENLDRALENEALTFCRAFQEGGGRALAGDLAAFAPRDLYLLLAYGRAEANEPIFAAALPRLHSLLPILDRTRNLRLRDFVAAAVAAQRLDAFLAIAGPEVMDRLARGMDQADDRLQEAVTVAQVIDGAAGRANVERLGAAIAAEYARAERAKDRQVQTLYGLLAARMVQNSEGGPAVKEIAGRYLPYLTSADRFPTAALFGANNVCVERHFFYDDEDGVESFESFRSVYARDPAWKLEERDGFVQITGEGAGGRRIEIFANRPINSRLPANAARTDEAGQRQEAISAALDARGVVPAFLVHRGHSFWVERTIRYVSSSAKLVFLGSCGGAVNIHSVIEHSRDAQVIATRGIGTTDLNDAILKSLNDWLLRGDAFIDWAAFWRAQKAQHGRHPMFRDYFAPDQDTASILLRAYFQCGE